MDADKWFSIMTYAGIVGLLVLNFDGATALFQSLSSAGIGYVKTVQGR